MYVWVLLTLWVHLNYGGLISDSMHILLHTNALLHSGVCGHASAAGDKA